MITGSRAPRRSNASSMAKRAALAFSVSNTVSTSRRSTPPSSRPSIASPYAAVVLLGEPRTLDHGAHRAVEQHDAATQQRGQAGGMRGNGHHGAPATKPVQLCVKRAFRRVSLAAFVTRPQAEHQIGAMRGSLPTPSQRVNRAAYNPPRS